MYLGDKDIRCTFVNEPFENIVRIGEFNTEHYISPTATETRQINLFVLSSPGVQRFMRL